MMRLLSKLQAAMPASLTTRLALAYGLTTAAVLVGVATYLSSSLGNQLQARDEGELVGGAAGAPSAA
jgi:two-component system heavy metal sensor histidine kinase CusS